MHHLGLTSPNYNSEYSTLVISANILPIPAVIMLIVAGRGFIFWCFNILSIPIVLSYAKRILYGGKQTPDTSTDERDFPYAARAQSHGNDNILEVCATYYSGFKRMFLHWQSNLVYLQLDFVFLFRTFVHLDFRIISRQPNGVDTVTQVFIINISTTT